MDSQDLRESQDPLGKMGCPVFQAQRDPRGCLASQAFLEREESQVQRDNLAERERLERRAGLASQETRGQEVSKEQEDLLELKEKWPSFPERGNRGNLGLLGIMASQEREVTQEFLECKGEEESQEDMDHLDSTEGSLVEMGSVGFLDPLALQAHPAHEGSLAFQGFQEIRVSQALQDPLDFQELMEQKDLKETKVSLPVGGAHLVLRVTQAALDVKDMVEPLEIKACLEFQD